MVFCVGVESAGKSFLLSSLCDPSFQQDTYLVPTVGINIFTLNIDSRTTATIRELGGALCAVWSSYIASETKLIFVTDSSDLGSIALVATKLTECVALLEENSAKENKVIIESCSFCVTMLANFLVYESRQLFSLLRIPY